MVDYFVFEKYAGLGYHVEVEIWLKDNEVHYTKSIFGDKMVDEEDVIASINSEEFNKAIEQFNISKWEKNYEPKGYAVFDGEDWTVKLKNSGEPLVTRKGENAYPRNWKKFETFIKSIVGDINFYED